MHPIHVVEHRSLPETLGHASQLNALLAQALHSHGPQLERIAHGRLFGDKLLGQRHMELRLGGTGASTAGKPCELLAHEVLAPLLGYLRYAVAFHALQKA